jgi:xylitol oxidase
MRWYRLAVCVSVRCPGGSPPLAARPHWGKLFTMSPAELKSIYERLPDFIQLSEKYDPHGKFRNEFLRTNIFSS